MQDFVPHYSTPEPNQTIPLSTDEKVEIVFEGTTYQGKADIWLEFLPKPGLVINALFPDDSLALQRLAQQSRLLRFPSLNAECNVLLRSIGTEFEPRPMSRITFYPRVGQINIRNADKPLLQRVDFHLLNFLDFHCLVGGMSTDRIVEEVEGDRQNFESLGCAVLMADGWRITLTALPSTRNLMRAFEGTTGYAITHLGRIEREDGALFTGRRAEDLLDALHYFLSFARGFWTPPILPVGLTSDGQLAWEQWVIGKTHAWEYVPSWFDAKHGQLLAKVFPGFWNLWSSEAWHDPLRESIDWYLRSNTNGGDMGIILSQAALERLTYAYAVPNQGLPKFFPCPEQKKAREKKHRKQTKFEDLPASRKIFEVFSRLEIPVEIPEQLRSMRRTAEERSRKCGPQAFTYMRNKIVHASTLRAKEWMTILYETWSLGQWYVELLLLRLCRHTGEYSNRLEPGRMGDVTPVPWAGNEIATHSIDLGPD